MEGKALIEFDNVSFLYNPDTPFSEAPLKNVSLRIEKGTLSLLLGSNGAGKTTFLLLAAGLYRPTLGNIYIEGSDTVKTRGSFIRKLIGISFQHPEKYFFAETVKDEICYAAREFGFENVSERFSRVMNILELDANLLRDRSPFSLSGGEARKVAIGSSIIHDPEIVFLDEPTVSLDINGITCIRKIVKELKAEGKTVAISTHWPEYFLDIASDIIGLKEGKLCFHGSVKEFLSRSENWYENLGLFVEEGLYEIKEHFMKTGMVNTFNPVRWINA